MEFSNFDPKFEFRDKTKPSKSTKFHKNLRKKNDVCNFASTPVKVLNKPP